jgi:DNA-binding MarR family transcriptional regulator
MSDNLGFLISDIARLIRRTFDQRAKKLGITRPQWRVLTMLMRHEGVNQSELAEILELDAMTLCRMVDRLQEAGLVERRADPRDRRAWQLYLTEKAAPIIDVLRPTGEALLQEAMEGIDDINRELLHQLLGEVRTNLSRTEGLESVAKKAANG